VEAGRKGRVGKWKEEKGKRNGRKVRDDM